MDINEFSIACKLIHLKLRGTEIPKTLPPSLINSLKVFSRPGSGASSPMAAPGLIGAPPARPTPPKPDAVHQVPLVQAAPMVPPHGASNVNLLSQVRYIHIRIF